MSSNISIGRVTKHRVRCILFSLLASAVLYFAHKKTTAFQVRTRFAPRIVSPILRRVIIGHQYESTDSELAGSRMCHWSNHPVVGSADRLRKGRILISARPRVTTLIFMHKSAFRSEVDRLYFLFVWLIILWFDPTCIVSHTRHTLTSSYSEFTDFNRISFISFQTILPLKSSSFFRTSEVNR